MWHNAVFFAKKGINGTCFIVVHYDNYYCRILALKKSEQEHKRVPYKIQNTAHKSA